MRNIYIPLAGIAAWLLTRLVDAFDMVSIAGEIVAGTAPAPFQYRPLTAHLLAPLADAVGDVLALWLFWFVVLGVLALLMDEWLRVWLPAERARTGVLLALILSLAFISFVPGGAIWSGPETLFWLATLLLLHRKRYGWLVPVVFVATLNRETAIFLVLLVFLATRRWGLTALLVLAWAVVYGAIRLYYGPVEPMFTVAETWARNSGGYRLGYFLVGLALFGWLPCVAARRLRGAPPLLKQAALVAIPYIGLIALFGTWREFRLFLPLLPVVVPLALGKAGTAGTEES